MRSMRRYICIWLLAIASTGVAACAGPETIPVADEITAVTEIADPTAVTPTPTAVTPTPTAVTPTPTAVTPTPAAVNPTPLAQMETNGGALPTATSTPLPSPTATPIPTSTIVEGWLVYENEFLGYHFSYPPEARIKRQGVTGFPLEELPESITSEEYLEQLEEIYPNDLCISLQYRGNFVTFVPSGKSGGRYTGPCGITGFGDYDMTSVSETILIDGMVCTADGWRLSWPDRPTPWHGEAYFLQVDDNDTIIIQYGRFGGTQQQFLDAQETLQQIVASYRSERNLACKQQSLE